jgi:hypothetical protein
MWYLHNYYLHLLDLISSEKSYWIFCWSSLFDDWFEFSTFFRNVRIVLSNICFVLTCVKQLSILYRYRYYSPFLYLILSELPYCVFCRSLLFDVWSEFSSLFPNVWKVMSSIWFVSTCDKHLRMWYLHKYYLHLLNLITSEKSYWVFCWSSLFDDWFDFSTFFFEMFE